MRDDLDIDTGIVAEWFETDDLWAFLGDLSGALDGDARAVLPHSVEPETGRSYAETRLDRYADHPDFDRAVAAALASQDLNGTADVAAALFPHDRPFSNVPFRPSFAPSEGDALQRYVSLDGTREELVPPVEDALPYRERFDRAMRHAVTYAHNFETLRHESRVTVPGIEIHMAEGNEGPWPYIVAEHVDGPALSQIWSKDCDEIIDMQYGKANVDGEKLAKDRKISYRRLLGGTDYRVDDDQTLYLVHPGHYIPEKTEDQFADDPHVPDPDEVDAMADPDYWDGPARITF